MATVFGLLVLCLLGLPTWGGARSEGDRQLCHANFRQLTRAWLMYAEDHGGRLPGNLDGGEIQDPRSTNRTWAAGWFDAAGTRPDTTNTALLEHAQLGRYVESAAVFRCPADPSLSRRSPGAPRVRSVSMNSYVGQRAQPYTAGYRQFTTLPSIVDPRPAGCLVFVEEREDSLNDGWFIIDMEGYDPRSPSRYRWVDYPSARHDGAGTMSFADGHVEAWAWQDSRTRPPLRPGQPLVLGVAQPNNPDVARVHEGASRRTTSLP